MSLGLDVSRRAFARLLGAGVAATALPSWALQAGAAVDTALEPIRLHFNENPYGPSPAGRRALGGVAEVAWQYPGAARQALIADLSRLHQIPADQILPGNGSSETLQAAAAAFLSSAKPLVVAEPTYEALEQYATQNGARTVKVPLAKSWAHDLAAMLAAHRSPGLLYICNPNNPTASITPKASVREAIRKASPETTVIVDEAYAHYAFSDDYESMIPLIASHPNLLVLRTFSKIYGLAGLRLGYGMAQPALIARLRAKLSRNSLNAAALLAARASLTDTDWVEESRTRNRRVRDGAIAELKALGFDALPTEANFFMVDLGRDVQPVIDAMGSKGVAVGRPFPPLTRHLRVTVGTEDQMKRFVSAFRSVTG